MASAVEQLSESVHSLICRRNSFGLICDRTPVLRYWVSHIHPDDRERALQYCETSVVRRENLEFEYRMIAAEGRLLAMIVEQDWT
jgi:hypothetical protein